MSDFLRISGCGNDTRALDLVFFHGLGGDALGTWRAGEDEASSWPHWLGAEFPQIGVWSLGYAASPNMFSCLLGLFTKKRDAGQSMALPDRAGQVLDRMLQLGLGPRSLVFACHSLGGLLLKQLLRGSLDATSARKRGVRKRGVRS